MTLRRARIASNRRLVGGQIVRSSFDAPGRAVLRARGAIGRHLSVRWKLTLWYGVMCALTLSVAGFGMRSILDSTFSRSVDDSLKATSAKLAPKLTAPLVLTPGGPLHHIANCQPSQVGSAQNTYAAVLQYCWRAQQILRQNSGPLSSPGQYVEVKILANINSGSATLAAPGQDGNRKISLLPSIPPRVLFDITYGPPKLLTLTKNHKTWRVHVSLLQVPRALAGEGGAAFLVIFQDEKTYRSIERTVDTMLIVGIPLAVLVALIAGWWIARAALRPINRISRTVKAIGESKDLSRRLRFVGPDDEVGRLAETFDGMMARLEAVFETQKRFIADASHELRTPLTAIRGNADLMTIAPPEEREVCLTAIRREADRMTRLVSDLLLLAEADVAEQPIEKREVDLDEIVIDVYRSARVMSDGKVSVLLEQAQPASVIGDPDRLKQLLLNLVDNAIKFTPAGGTVALRVYPEGDNAFLEVADSGVGIPPDQQAAIFERFYRVEESRATRGSGLGLSIVAWVAAAHGGSVDVRSQPDKGSTFSVRLPLAGRRNITTAGVA